MANYCRGILKVVTKNKDVIERIKRIFNYEDDEYCLHHVHDFQDYGEMYEDGDYFVQNFIIAAPWLCEPFLNHGDFPDKKLCIKKVYKDGKWNREYGTAHFTDLSHLATVLGFGCEFWTEDGMMFAEHGLVKSDGHYEYDIADYEISFPKKKDGDYDYDNPIEKSGFGEGWKDWMYAKEIYGEEGGVKTKQTE